MFKLLTTITLFFIALIFGITYFLQPNDLSKCDISPSNSIGCNTVDAIVAVSGGDTTSRAKHAINLYKNGWSKKLVFSGAALDKSGPSNAAVMRLIAIDAGVPETNILIDENSETTTQNAINTQTLFTKNNIKSVILVTSGYHQRRASLEFNKQTNDISIINSPAKSDNDWSFWWWSTSRGWWLATTEIAKILIIFVVGLWQ